MHRLSRFVAAAFIGTTLASCGGGGGDDPPTAPTPVLTTLNVSFQSGPLIVGQTATATAAGLDQFGTAIATGNVTWSTTSPAIATVNSSGLVTAVAVGETQVIANAGGKQAAATVTVNVQTVANVYVSPPTVTLGVGDTRQLVAAVVDANNNTVTGRTVSWATTDGSKATVNATTGLVTAVAAGEATISATADGKTGTALVTVSNCNSSTALQLTVGQIRTLTAAEATGLCLGSGGSASEYVLIPFSNINSASATTPVRITGANTVAILPGQLASPQPGSGSSLLRNPSSASMSGEIAFRERERRDISAAFASTRQLPLSRRKPRDRRAQGGRFSPSFLTGIPAAPVVGDTYQINGNISGNTCASPKQMRGATVVAVLPSTIVLSDVTSPAGGWTNAEMAEFGQAFEDIGYPLDVATFGQPSDIDANGRVAILFTPGVNVLSNQPGFVVGGAFAARDLFPVTATPTSQACAASNEGEMFYMPVPDPGSTLNGNYTNKDNMKRGNLSVLVHEMQHLINAGRRIYVNDAFDFEEVWLNEGLSHIAEELLYYRISGNSPRTNIDLPTLRSSQAQLDAVNSSMVSNLGRLSTYMRDTEGNSPFDVGDALETRGAIWQLLRYSQDRKGGSDQATWSALVNTRESGQTNFNAVFGNIITMTRDWVVAQFTDDSGLPVAPSYMHPSWNFRSILPAINNNAFPLTTRSLASSPVDVTLIGGGAAYVRFRIEPSVAATITATSSGAAVPATIDLILVRTQ